MQWLLDVDGKDTGSRLCLVDGGLTVGFLTNSQFVIWYIIHDILFLFGNKQKFVIKSLWPRKDLCLSW